MKTKAYFILKIILISVVISSLTYLLVFTNFKIADNKLAFSLIFISSFILSLLKYENKK